LTKFWANEATSTPEPAPKDVNIFCALALLAAATAAAEAAAGVTVVLAVVLEDVALVVAVVAMGCTF
jgi:hypothetical protein